MKCRLLAPRAPAAARDPSLAADQALGDAARDHAFEQVAEEVAVAEAAMPVLGEGRVVWDRVHQVEPAEPAIGEVQMDLLAEPPLRPDAHDVADEQHADHQLRVDRWSTDRAVERRQVAADAREVDEAIDCPQQVISRHVVLERELIEQRALRHLPRTHHRRHPLATPSRSESAAHASCNGAFQHNQPVADTRQSAICMRS